MSATSSWIPDNTILSGQTIELIPLKKEFFPELEKLAKDKRIWEFLLFDGTDSEKLITSLNTALIEKENGNQFPFVIYHKVEKRIIGTTRFLEIVPTHRKLEIGWTWIHPDYWATRINFECKLLLLKFCFENIKTIRVQLKTDENNLRSRKAIEKIGGIYEGVFRNDLIRDNGTKRNSAYYSIIDEEWPAAKAKILSSNKMK